MAVAFKWYNRKPVNAVEITRDNATSIYQFLNGESWGMWDFYLYRESDGLYLDDGFYKYRVAKWGDYLVAVELGRKYEIWSAERLDARKE